MRFLTLVRCLALFGLHLLLDPAPICSLSSFTAFIHLLLDRCACRSSSDMLLLLALYCCFFLRFFFLLRPASTSSFVRASFRRLPFVDTRGPRGSRGGQEDFAGGARRAVGRVALPSRGALVTQWHDDGARSQHTPRPFARFLKRHSMLRLCGFRVRDLLTTGTATGSASRLRSSALHFRVRARQSSLSFPSSPVTPDSGSMGGKEYAALETATVGGPRQASSAIARRTTTFSRGEQRSKQQLFSRKRIDEKLCSQA